MPIGCNLYLRRRVAGWLLGRVEKIKEVRDLYYVYMGCTEKSSIRR